MEEAQAEAEAVRDSIKQEMLERETEEQAVECERIGKRNKADAVCRFGCSNYNSTHRGIGDIPLDLNNLVVFINVFPFQPHTLSPANACCDKQMEHTPEIQRTTGEQLEQFDGLFLCQCVNRLPFLFGSIDLTHRVSHQQLILFRIAKD